MLSWSTPEDHAYAESLFEKFKGYHEDALNSTGLRPRIAANKQWCKEAKLKTEENEEWTDRYGKEAANTIRSAVDQCQEDYEYLRQFRIRPEEDADKGKDEIADKPLERKSPWQ